MTRQGFSQLLVDIRKMTKCSVNEISGRSRMGVTMIRRVETAGNNYHLANAIKYLVSLNWGLRLTNRHSSILVVDYKSVPEFLNRIRIAEGVPKSQLAKKANVTGTAIYSMESQKTTLCIDTFLAIASALNINISMEHL